MVLTIGDTVRERSTGRMGVVSPCSILGYSKVIWESGEFTLSAGDIRNFYEIVYQPTVNWEVLLIG